MQTSRAGSIAFVGFLASTAVASTGWAQVPPRPAPPAPAGAAQPKQPSWLSRGPAASKPDQAAAAGEEAAGEAAPEPPPPPPPPPPPSPEPEVRRAKLSWGVQVVEGHTTAVSTGEDAPDRESEEDGVRDFSRRDGSRGWRFRLQLPTIGILTDFDNSATLLSFGAGVEIDDAHVLMLRSGIGLDDDSYGAHATYGYQVEIAQDAVLLELAGGLGYQYFEMSYDSNCDDTGCYDRVDEGGTYFFLDPTFHLGYKAFFFSIGPRLSIGDYYLVGIAAGISLRL